MQETNRDSTKSSLSQPNTQLIELMQHVNFGRIEGIPICNGELILDPPPRVIREIKFCAENGPRPETTKQDFVLKAQVRDFFAQVEALGNGVIHSLEVKHGLPFKMIVEENTA